MQQLSVVDAEFDTDHFCQCMLSAKVLPAENISKKLMKGELSAVGGSMENMIF